MQHDEYDDVSSMFEGGGPLDAVNVNFPDRAKQAVQHRKSFLRDTKSWANARPIEVKVNDLSEIGGLEHRFWRRGDKTIAKEETAARIVLEGKRAVDKLRLATEQINSLNNVAIDFAKKVHELDAYIDALEPMARQAKHWKEVAYANKGTAEQYEQERAELAKTIQEMERERVRVQEAVNVSMAKSREEKEKLRRDKEKLQKENATLKTSERAVQEQLRGAEKAKESLNAEATRAKGQAVAAFKELEREQAKNKKLQQQLNEVVAEREQLNKKVEENRELEAAIAFVNARLAQAQGESQRLSEQLSAITAHQAARIKEAEEARTRAQQFERQLVEQTNVTKTLQDQLTAAQQERDALVQQVGARNRSVTENEARIVELQRQLQLERQRVAAVEDAQKQAAEHAQAQMREAAAREQQLRENLAEADSRAREAEATQQTMAKDKSTAETAAQQTIRDLEEQNRELQRQQAAAVEEARTLAQEQIDATRQQLSTALDTIKELQTSMASTQGQTADVAAQLERVQSELRQVQREREDASKAHQAELQSLGQRLGQARTEVDRTTREAQAQLQLEKEAHAADVDRLNALLRQERATREHTQGEALQALNQRIVDLEKAHQQELTRISSQQKEAEQLRVSESERLQAKVDDLAREQRTAAEQARELERQLLDIEAQKATADAELSREKEQVAALQRQLQEQASRDSPIAQELQAKLTEIQNANMKLAATLDEVTIERDTTRVEATRVAEEMAERHRREAERIAADLQSVRELLAVKNDTIAQLQVAGDQEAKRLRDELTRAREEVEQVKEQIAKYQNDATTAHQADAQEIVDQLRRELDQQKISLDAVQAAAALHVQQAERDKEALRAQLAEQIDRLHQENENLRKAQLDARPVPPQQQQQQQPITNEELEALREKQKRLEQQNDDLVRSYHELARQFADTQKREQEAAVAAAAAAAAAAVAQQKKAHEPLQPPEAQPWQNLDNDEAIKTNEQRQEQLVEDINEALRPSTSKVQQDERAQEQPFRPSFMTMFEHGRWGRPHFEGEQLTTAKAEEKTKKGIEIIEAVRDRYVDMQNKFNEYAAYRHFGPLFLDILRNQVAQNDATLRAESTAHFLAPGSSR